MPTRSQLAGGGRSGSHAAAVTTTHKPKRIKRPATSKPIEVTIMPLSTLGLPAIFQGDASKSLGGRLRAALSAAVAAKDRRLPSTALGHRRARAGFSSTPSARGLLLGTISLPSRATMRLRPPRRWKRMGMRTTRLLPSSRVSTPLHAALLSSCWRSSVARLASPSALIRTSSASSCTSTRSTGSAVPSRLYVHKRHLALRPRSAALRGSLRRSWAPATPAARSPHLQLVPSAWVRSATRSAACSIPIDSRIVASVMPRRSRVGFGTPE